MRRFALLVALCCTAASAIASEVGLINHIAGDVEYVRGSSTAKVKAFMIVRDGDMLSAAPGAQITLVYFQGGRQESFTGPAMFTAGAC